MSTVNSKHASTPGKGKLLYFAVMIDNYEKMQMPGLDLKRCYFGLLPVTSATLVESSTHRGSVTSGTLGPTVTTTGLVSV